MASNDAACCSATGCSFDARTLMVVSFRWLAAPGGACCLVCLGLACESIKLEVSRAAVSLSHGLPQHVFLAHWGVETAFVFLGPLLPD